MALLFRLPLTANDMIVVGRPCLFVRLCCLFIDIIPSPNIRTRIMEKLCSANFRVFILAWLVWRGWFADSFVATLHSNNNTTTQLHFPFILFVWVFHVFFLCVCFYIRLEHPIIAILLLLGRWRLLTEFVSTHPTSGCNIILFQTTIKDVLAIME